MALQHLGTRADFEMRLRAILAASVFLLGAFLLYMGHPAGALLVFGSPLALLPITRWAACLLRELGRPDVHQAYRPLGREEPVMHPEPVDHSERIFGTENVSGAGDRG